MIKSSFLDYLIILVLSTLISIGISYFTHQKSKEMQVFIVDTEKLEKQIAEFTFAFQEKQKTYVNLSIVNDFMLEAKEECEKIAIANNGIVIKKDNLISAGNGIDITNYLFEIYKNKKEFQK